jgi:hypothetical protein
MSLNTGDQGYNNGKKYGQKGTICGPNKTFTQHQQDFQNLQKDASILPA